jgi:hypothetical protein
MAETRFVPSDLESTTYVSGSSLKARHDIADNRGSFTG